MACVQKGELLRLEGVWFYHRVPQGVPFYHISVVQTRPAETANRVFNMTRTLPGMAVP